MHVMDVPGSVNCMPSHAAAQRLLPIYSHISIIMSVVPLSANPQRRSPPQVTPIYLPRPIQSCHYEVT